MHRLFDEGFPAAEQLPRHFSIQFRATRLSGLPAVRLMMGSHQIGDILTDNSHVDDGYRFHDVFHFAHAAILGWSPMARALFGRKRKSIPMIDVVEDGGRAKILEEAICAIVFSSARENSFFSEPRRISRSLLRTIRSIASGCEVARRPTRDWERAILQGYGVWRKLRAAGQGVVVGDLKLRELSFEPLSPSDASLPNREGG